MALYEDSALYREGKLLVKDGKQLVIVPPPKDANLICLEITISDGAAADFLIGDQFFTDRFNGVMSRASYTTFVEIPGVSHIVTSSTYVLSNVTPVQYFTQAELDGISNATQSNPHQFPNSYRWISLIIDKQYYPKKFSFSYRRAWEVIQSSATATLYGRSTGSTETLKTEQLNCDGDWHTFTFNYGE